MALLSFIDKLEQAKTSQSTPSVSNTSSSDTNSFFDKLNSITPTKKTTQTKSVVPNVTQKKEEEETDNIFRKFALWLQGDEDLINKDALMSGKDIVYNPNSSSPGSKIQAATTSIKRGPLQMTDYLNNNINIFNQTKLGKFAQDNMTTQLNGKVADKLSSRISPEQRASGTMGTLDVLFPIDQSKLRTPASTQTEAVQQLRETSKEGMSDKAKFFADLGYSSIDMATGILLNAVAPGSGLAYMGMQAAGSATYNAKQSGATDLQAALIGTVAGAIEAITEKIPMDNLFKIAKGAGAGTVIKNLLKQVGLEGTQELISEIVNTITNTAVLQDKSNKKVSIANYMQQGMTEEEAKKQVFKDQLNNYKMAFAGGAIMGGLFGTGANIVGNSNNTNSQPTTDTQQPTQSTQMTAGDVQAETDTNTPQATQNDVTATPVVQNKPIQESTFDEQSKIAETLMKQLEELGNQMVDPKNAKIRRQLEIEYKLLDEKFNVQLGKLQSMNEAKIKNLDERVNEATKDVPQQKVSQAEIVPTQSDSVVEPTQVTQEDVTDTEQTTSLTTQELETTQETQKQELPQMQMDTIGAKIEGDSVITQQIEQAVKDGNIEKADSLINDASKTSQFALNTLLNSQVIPEQLKVKVREAIENGVYDYTPITNKETTEKAIKNFKAEITPSMLKDIGFESADQVANLYQQYLEALRNNDYELSMKIFKMIQPKTTNTAQALQYISVLKRMSPEGKLSQAQSEVQKSQQEVEYKHPGAIEKVEETSNIITGLTDAIETSKVNAVMTEVEKELDKPITTKKRTNKSDIEKIDKEIETDNEVKKEEKTPEEILADMIDNSAFRTNKTKKPLTDEQIMIKTLFNVAKEQLPNTTTKNEKTHATTLIYKALENRSEYYETWSKTKNILKNKYNMSEEKIAVLQDYIDTRLRPVFFEKDLNKAVKEKLKQNNINMRDVVKKHYSVNSEIRGDLVDTMVTELKLNIQEAEYLTKFINNKMKDLTKQAKEQELNKLFKTSSNSYTNSLKQHSIINKIIEYTNLGGFENDAYKNIILESLGIPNLTNAESRFIVQTMKDIQTIEDPEISKYVKAQVEQLIANKKVAPKGEKIKGYLRMSMLMNPKTMIRNPMGNFIMSSAEMLTQPIRGVADVITSKALDTPRTRTILPQVGAGVKGAVKGFLDWSKDSKYGVNTSPTRGMAELPRTQKIYKTEALNKIHEFMAQGLKLGDRWAYESAGAKRRSELKKIRPDMTEAEVEAEAMLEGLEQTYQNDSRMKKALTTFRRALNTLSVKGVGIGDIVMPFVETPANIAAKTVEYTPLGVIKVAQEMPTKKNLHDGTFNQKAFVDAIGRSSGGTLLLALGVYLAKQGQITGGYPEDEDEKRLWKSRGKQPYSFKVGNKWVSYSNLEPLSSALAAGVDSYNAYIEEGHTLKALRKGAVGGINTLFQQTVLRGLSGLFGGYSVGENLMQLPSSLGSQSIPSLVGYAAQYKDEYEREADSNLEYLQKKIPGASEKLPIQYDVFGKPMKTLDDTTGIKRFLNGFFNISRTSTEKTDKVINEIDDLYSVSKNGDLIPGEYKSFSYDGIPFTTTTDERSIIGNAIYDAYKEIMESKEYKSAKTKAEREGLLIKGSSQAELDAKQQIAYGRDATLQQKDKIAQYQSVLGNYAPSYTSATADELMRVKDVKDADGKNITTGYIDSNEFSYSNKTIKVDDNTVKQYNTELDNQISQLMNTSKYKSMNDIQKTEAISNIRTEVIKEYKHSVVRQQEPNLLVSLSNANNVKTETLNNVMSMYDEIYNYNKTAEPGKELSTSALNFSPVSFRDNNITHKLNSNAQKYMDLVIEQYMNNMLNSDRYKNSTFEQRYKLIDSARDSGYNVAKAKLVEYFKANPQ